MIFFLKICSGFGRDALNRHYINITFHYACKSPTRPKDKWPSLQFLNIIRNSLFMLCLEYFVMYGRPSGERLEKLLDLTRSYRTCQPPTHERTGEIVKGDSDSTSITLSVAFILINWLCYVFTNPNGFLLVLFYTPVSYFCVSMYLFYYIFQLSQVKETMLSLNMTIQILWRFVRILKMF